MKTRTNALINVGVAFAGVMLAATFVVVSVRAGAVAQDFDAAGMYKT
jgi:hypothetical protein